MVCSFCGVEKDYVAEGPGVSICEDCVVDAASRTQSVDQGGACSFCRQNREIVLVNMAGDIRICTACIRIANQVIEHKRAGTIITPR
jgi:hypothetical protein